MLRHLLFILIGACLAIPIGAIGGFVLILPFFVVYNFGPAGVPVANALALVGVGGGAICTLLVVFSLQVFRFPYALKAIMQLACLLSIELLAIYAFDPYSILMGYGFILPSLIAVLLTVGIATIHHLRYQRASNNKNMG